MIDTQSDRNVKSEHATGAFNISLGVVLFIDGILIAVMAFCCLLMSFSLFFMAAIPAFLLIGALCVVTFVAAAVHTFTGIGIIIASKRSMAIRKVLTVVAIIADVAVIPANIIALVCGIYLLTTEIDWLSVLIFIVAAIAIALAFSSLILSVIRVLRRS